MKIKLFILILLTVSSSLLAEVNPNLKKYVSSECNTLIGIDMKSLLAIPALNAIMQSDQKELQQMSELGIRPQDIQSVIIGLNSNALASDPLAFEKQPELISISHVKEGITLEKLVKAAEENKVQAKRQEVDGVNVVLLNKDGKEFVMAQLDPYSIAVGSMKMVKKAIALKADSAKGRISENKKLSDLAKAQKDLFWVVGAKPQQELKSGENAPLDNPMTSVFGDLTMFTLSLGFNGKEVLLNSDLICKNKEGADRLAITGQFLTAGLAAAEDSPVKADQINFSQTNETVNIKIAIDSAALIKAVQAAKGLAGE